jgi:hypothetical protein
MAVRRPFTEMSSRAMKAKGEGGDIVGGRTGSRGWISYLVINIFISYFLSLISIVIVTCSRACDLSLCI